MHKPTRTLAVLAVLSLTPAVVAAQGGGTYRAPAADVEAVRQAAFNYIDAIYRAQPQLVEKSVHPTLAKRGFFQARDGSWSESPMTYAQLLEVARTWNDDGETLREGAPREVVIHEVLNRTASAKVIAQWGIDYLQLARFGDEWKIVNIVWQSHPQ